MDWIKQNKNELRVQAMKFSAGLATYGSGLNLTSSEVTGFATAFSTYGDSLDEAVAAKAAADMAYETFLTDKVAMVKLMRKYNVRMQAASGITNAKRAEIGIPIPGASTTVEPKTVTDLVATPFATGAVNLKWKRSGNAPTVVFNIEVSDDAVTWDLLTNTTSVKIQLSGYAPGVTKYFRVVATRGLLHAIPSLPAAIYSGSGSGTFELAA